MWVREFYKKNHIIINLALCRLYQTPTRHILVSNSLVSVYIHIVYSLLVIIENNINIYNNCMFSDHHRYKDEVKNINDPLFNIIRFNTRRSFKKT